MNKMNNYQTKLYYDLMELVNTHESFFYRDHLKDNSVYRIFNYRLVNYTDYIKSPVAFESRGIMFKVTNESDDATPIELSAMPMEKFFNVAENPFTENLDFSQIKTITPKFDGSLISTYMHNDELYLKSKGSLVSDQALDAMEWLKTRSIYLNHLKEAEKSGYTVNLEWVSPLNRIVLLYDFPELVVLNIRDKTTGEYINIEEFDSFLYSKSVFDNDVSFTNDFIEKAYKEEDIEGYVLEFNDGKRAKLKTEWYCNLHRSLDDVMSIKKLSACILNESVDDLKSMFHDNPTLIDYMNRVEQIVDYEYNHLVKSIEDFYNRFKNTDRKTYAITAKNMLNEKMGLAMSLYLGRETQYIDYFMKYMLDIVSQKLGENIL